MTRRWNIVVFIVVCAFSIIGCAFRRSSDLNNFVAAYKHVETGMRRSAVEVLLGAPKTSITDASPEWGLTPITFSTYTSTNACGKMGLADIMYLGDQVYQKKLKYVRPIEVKKKE